MSKISEKVVLKGQIKLTLKDKNGKIKKVVKANTVTTVGKNGVADQLLAAPSINKPSHIAVGTGTPSGTALGSELDRNALASKTRLNNVVTMTGAWAAGDGTGAITEAGIFNAAAAGDMYLSASFAVVNKGANDTLDIDWTLTIN